jgi:hypothetical protein
VVNGSQVRGVNNHGTEHSRRNVHAYWRGSAVVEPDACVLGGKAIHKFFTWGNGPHWFVRRDHPGMEIKGVADGAAVFQCHFKHVTNFAPQRRPHGASIERPPAPFHSTHWPADFLHIQCHAVNICVFSGR